MHEVDRHIYEKWEERAVDALINRPFPDVRFDVVQRVGDTASMALRVVETPEGDEYGPRMEVVSRNDKCKDRGAVAMTFADFEAGKEPDENRSLPEGLVLEAASETDQMDHLRGSSTGAVLTGFEELMRDFDFRLMFPDGEIDLSANHAFFLAEYIDKYLFWTPVSEDVKKSNVEAIKTYYKYIVLAKILFECFGEKVVNLVLAMLLFVEHEQDDDDSKKYWSIRAWIMGASRDMKIRVFKELISRYSTSEDSYEEVVKWALGDRFYYQLAQDRQNPIHFKDFNQVLSVLEEIFYNSSEFRERVLLALRSSTHGVDRVVTGALLRQGWVTLAEMTREVTDYEWHETLKKQIDDLLADPEKQSMVFRTEEHKALFSEQQEHIASFFENNEKPDPAEVKTLAQAIGCDDLRAEMMKVTLEHNPFAHAALQIEAASRIVKHVSRYKKTEKGDVESTWEAGFPVNVVKNKDATCFSGPMLIAMLMIKSGIPQKNIFYCSVNEGFNGILGGHGSIILRTRMNELYLFDHGYSVCGRTLYPVLLGELASEFVDLVFKGRKQVVSIDIDPIDSKVLGIHRNMQVMPIIEGFGAGHMLHVGLNFLSEGDYEQAVYAFELGLSYSYTDPDLLHGIARTSFERGDYIEAIKYGKLALRAFEDHAWARMTLAESYLEIGAIEDGIELLEGLVAEEREIYQGDFLKDKAKDLLEGLKDVG